MVSLLGSRKGAAHPLVVDAPEASESGFVFLFRHHPEMFRI